MPKKHILIGDIKKRKIERLQEFKDELSIGMLADDVLALAYNKLVRQIKEPRKIDTTDLGYVVEWYYPGIILEMGRVTLPGAYRISKIREIDIITAVLDQGR